MAEMTLEEAKAWLRARIDEGARCPCCEQFAKVYERPLYGTQARDLILFYRAHGRDWGNAKMLGRSSADFCKLRFWGLVEPMEGEREDGSKRVGIWRVTERGEKFIQRHVRVHRKVRLYDNRLLNRKGDQVGIDECLGKKFSYAELMA